MLKLHDPYKCPRCHRIYCECGPGCLVFGLILLVLAVFVALVYGCAYLTCGVS